jgi:hypothetical protein
MKRAVYNIFLAILLFISVLFFLFLLLSNFQVRFTGNVVQEFWCEGADMNEDGSVDGTDLSILSGQFRRIDCSIVNDWCEGADMNEDGSVDGTDLSILSGQFRRIDCAGPLYSCYDSDGNNPYVFGFANWSDNSGEGYGSDFCGSANGLSEYVCVENQHSIISHTCEFGCEGNVCLSEAPTCLDGTEYSQCSLMPPKYCSEGTLIDNCLACGCPTEKFCQSNGACLSSNILLDASWSSSLDILADEAFDRSMNAPYLMVNQSNETYVLKALGNPTPGVHKYDRVVVEDFDPLTSWGGEVHVNLDNVDMNSFQSTDLAFVGGYENSGTTRNFVIGARFQINYTALSGRDKKYNVRDAGGFIYLKAFHYNNDALPSKITQTVLDREQFYVPDTVYNVRDAWPDRFIKIEWFIKNGNTLYARVDGGEVKTMPTGTHITPFKNFRIGWVSSFTGGSFETSKVILYDGSEPPAWVP